MKNSKKIEKKIEYVWAAQAKAKDFEEMDCKEYNPYDDFLRDPTGFYILVRINFEKYRIEVGICNKDHQIVKLFSGRKPQDIYSAIFKYEKKRGVKWFEEKTHIAYLGKELKKAELALTLGNNAYYQE